MSIVDQMLAIILHGFLDKDSQFILLIVGWIQIIKGHFIEEEMSNDAICACISFIGYIRFLVLCAIDK